MTGPASNYSVEEVQALIEGYRPLREAATASSKRLWLLVRLVDLDIGFADLPPLNRAALTLCGIHGLTRQAAGTLLGVTEKTMDRRFADGIVALTNRLNGGTTV